MFLSIIRWNNNNSFDIDVSLSLRRARVDSIIGYRDGILIWFMTDTGLAIEYPDNLDHLPKKVESELFHWSDLVEGNVLSAYIIKRIANYIKEHLEEIKAQWN